MASALEGITILDLTQGAAGALATMFLCDNGARVIQIVAPDNDQVRKEPGFLVWDRGKEKVTLDLFGSPLNREKMGTGRIDRSPISHLDYVPDELNAFYRLVEASDVVVESFSPSSPYQALIGYELLSSLNPRLIQCSLTAYGSNGPLQDEPPIDELVMARTGILASQPSFRPGPANVIHPLPSVGAGLLAALGIVSTLFRRESTGVGGRVETSLMNGALMFAPKVIGEKIELWPPQDIPAGGGPFYSVFECADGDWVQLGCIHGGFVDLAAAVMGIADVIASPRFGDGISPSSDEARRELFDIVATSIRRRPYEEWAKIFDQADVPYARVSTTEESMSIPQVRSNDMVIDLEDPKVGRISQMGLPIKMSRTPGSIKGPRRLPGKDDIQVLCDIEKHKVPLDYVQGLSSRRTFCRPLDGVKVMEIGNVIAGPAAGKLLADLGADVIKLESLNGDIARASRRPYFFHLNSNKRSLSVNGRTPQGRKVVRRLAATADILLANMRPGATNRMGIGTESLAVLNPDVIESHITGFGTEGAFSHRAGVDPLAQAWMGLQRAQGGAERPPVFLAQLAPTDFAAGAMGALGAVMGLFSRTRTGQGQRVDTNLLNSGALLSAGAFTKYKDKPKRRLADRDHHGLGALHRLYHTSDGWIYIVSELENQWQALCEAMKRQDLLIDRRFSTTLDRCANDVPLATELSRSFAQEALVEWVRRLRGAEVPCAPVVEHYDIGFFSDPHATFNDMIVKHTHSALGCVKYSSQLLKFSNTASVKGVPTPLLGEHTKQVLEELGFDHQMIEELYQQGIVRTERAR